MISYKFHENIIKLKEYFPSANSFLTWLENQNSEINKLKKQGFWLGTDVNMHLYLNDGFLCYIKVNKPTVIEFSEHFHMKIYRGTENRSHLLFPELFRNVIKKHRGFEEGWAINLGRVIQITKLVPKSFFDDLIHAIENLRLSGLR